MTSMYDKGHTCHICKKHLDSYDSFTIKNIGTKQEQYLCTECDPDMKDQSPQLGDKKREAQKP